jgi:hypothetical protein
MNEAQLRHAIAGDLRPTRPLLPPSTRALLLAPLALATVLAVPSLNFYRPDLAEIGVVRIWALSILEACGGLWIVGLALRESIPGRTLSTVATTATIAFGLALPALVYLLTAERFDVGPSARALPMVSAICFRTSAAAAIPGIIASTVLVARAFPLRPGVAGALYGLGCGVIADAGLRLFCEFTIPVHVLAAHGGAIVASMVAGALVARLVVRR